MMDLPKWLSGKRTYLTNAGDTRDTVWFLGQEIPWSRTWQPTLVRLYGKFHGQRTLAGYSPWRIKESYMTEHACNLMMDICHHNLSKFIMHMMQKVHPKIKHEFGVIIMGRSTFNTGKKFNILWVTLIMWRLCMCWDMRCMWKLCTTLSILF